MHTLAVAVSSHACLSSPQRIPLALPALTPLPTRFSSALQPLTAPLSSPSQHHSPAPNSTNLSPSRPSRPPPNRTPVTSPPRCSPSPHPRTPPKGWQQRHVPPRNVGAHGPAPRRAGHRLGAVAGAPHHDPVQDREHQGPLRAQGGIGEDPDGGEGGFLVAGGDGVLLLEVAAGGC